MEWLAGEAETVGKGIDSERMKGKTDRGIRGWEVQREGAGGGEHRPMEYIRLKDGAIRQGGANKVDGEKQSTGNKEREGEQGRVKVGAEGMRRDERCTGWRLIGWQQERQDNVVPHDQEQHPLSSS